MPLYSSDKRISIESLKQLRKKLFRAYIMVAACIGFIALIVGARVLKYMFMMQDIQ